MIDPIDVQQRLEMALARTSLMHEAPEESGCSWLSGRCVSTRHPRVSPAENAM